MVVLDVSGLEKTVAAAVAFELRCEGQTQNRWKWSEQATDSYNLLKAMLLPLAPS